MGRSRGLRQPLRLVGHLGENRPAPAGLPEYPDNCARRVPAVVSFDVFETALVRSVGSPHAVFLLLGRQLVRDGFVSCSAEAFARNRLAADRRAFRNAGGRDSKTSLADIYRELPVIRDRSDKLCNLVAEMELAIEARLLRPHPEFHNLLAAWRARGTRVIYISDTYLPRWFIEEQLRSNGLLASGDGCFVSNDQAAAKSTGSLFRQVLQQEGLKPSSLLHVGNDLGVDINPARRLGIRAAHYGSGNLNRYEEVLETHRWSTDGLSSAMAGASRLARLSRPVGSRRQETIRDVAAGVAAPVLTAYVLWVLRRARQLEVDRLYFLSRDGQTLLSLAQQLSRQLEGEVDLRYLCVSRRAISLAAAGGINADSIGVVLSHAPQASIRALLDRLQLAPEQLRDPLEQTGLGAGNWDRLLDSTELDRFFDILLHNERCRSLIRSQAEASRTLVVRYLRQEAVLSPGRTGLVDLGGVGTQLQALASLRERAGQALPTGFLAYREAPEVAHARLAEPEIEAYLTDAVTGTGLPRFGGMVPFLEVFATADHGTVTDYEDHGPVVRPKLAASNHQLAASTGLRIMRGVMETFVSHLVLDPDLVDRDADVREPVLEVLRLLVESPSGDEASVWGSFPFGSDDESSGGRLASTWSLLDVLGLVRGRSLPSNWYTWRAGSLRLSSGPVRGAVRAARTTRGGLRVGRRLVSRVAARQRY